MPSLSDKLKALGVQQGAQGLPSEHSARPAGGHEFSIENVLPGRWQDTPIGETFVVDTFYPADFRHGHYPVLPGAPSEILARWTNEQRLTGCQANQFAFLDTETTGLNGGTGAYAFLIGIARVDEYGFHLAQFFMRDPNEESAQLAAVEQYLAPSTAVVTFNGKSYDIPLLKTRYISKGRPTPFQNTAHVDLLHLARRLWRDRLPDRSLASLEAQILGTARDKDDVPGWMIPGMYFQYLRDGDARPLSKIFYHNAMDIIAMASLLNCVAGLIAQPLETEDLPQQDRLALGRLYHDFGELPMAVQIYQACLAGESAASPPADLAAALEARLRLAGIHKQQENLAAAIPLWEQAAGQGHLEAHIELAKVYEHRLRDLAQATDWTIAAIRLVGGPGYSQFERRQILPELHHRLERLMSKAGHRIAVDPSNQAGDEPTI